MGITAPYAFEWTSAPGAQAYYLYVGTTAGAKDIVNTGELQGTSFSAQSLPWAQILYATIWTKVSGTWWSSSSTFTTAPQTAALTTPPSGAQGVSVPCTFDWTSIPNAQAYYLYVGTTPGAKDIVNTGAIQSTSYTAKSLPWSQTLYATIWTQIAGEWWPSSSVFSTVEPIAALTAPAYAAVGVSAPYTFQWTSVPNAQAYYLYVGTTPGGKDVVNSGETQATSYSASSLPWNETLYATIWTKVAGLWLSSSSTFTTVQQIAMLTAPSNLAVGISQPYTFQWTSVSNAQAYYLYVGAAPGSKNVVNTGELQATSYVATSLPASQTLYATMWTKTSGQWWSSSSVFTSAQQLATLTYPSNLAFGVPATCTFTWTSVSAAQEYCLYVGTTPGAKDVINSGGTSGTSFAATSLPYGKTLYATTFTKLANVWYATSSCFTTVQPIATLTSPANGATSVSPNTSFQWTSVPNAQGYALYVGTTPFGYNLVNTGTIPGTSYTPALPLTMGQTFYTTLFTEAGGVWYLQSSTFTTEQLPSTSNTDAIAAMTYPSNGSVNINAGLPFQWSTTPSAQAYWLAIGSMPGGHDVADSGPISVPRYFASNLPTGVTLYGQLFVEDSSGNWQLAQDFTFSAASNTIANSTVVQTALWAVNYVRQMANDSNIPYPGTVLEDVIYPRTNAVCSDYAAALVDVMVDMNVPLSFRTLEVEFDANIYDGHTLVEMYNPDQSQWMLLDPTFDLTAKRASDGLYATAEDINAATLSMSWSQIDYVFLGSQGDYFAVDYYLDYPLLYLNVYHQGTYPTLGQGPSVLPYYEQLAVPTIGFGIYAIRCTTQSTATFEDTVDSDTLYTLATDNVDSFSYIFEAFSVTEPPSGVTFELYTPRRFVF
jgi:hypothetical protein